MPVTAGPGERRSCEFPIVQRGPNVHCRNRAGAGTDHPGWGYCRWHGGNSPAQRTASARAVAQSLARELDVSPTEALLASVRLAAGATEAVRERIVAAEVKVEQDKRQFEKNEMTGEMQPTAATNELSMWYRVYGEALDRVARCSKMAIDAGISERLVRLEEEKVRTVSEALRRIFADPALALTPEQRAVVGKVSRVHLLALEAGQQTGT